VLKEQAEDMLFFFGFCFFFFFFFLLFCVGEWVVCFVIVL